MSNIVATHDIHISEVPFLVVDVETTGPSGADNRITEIACIVVRGGEIIEEFSSLMNPQQHIPASIARLTGISNSMVYTAPRTSTVMRRLQPLFLQPYAVFVAHNVSFDWSFVHHTFQRERMVIRELPRLCTYKLAKRLFPQRTRLNLQALASFFDIVIAERHRAHADAYATAQILVRILELLQEQAHVHTLGELLSFQHKRLEHFRKKPKSVEALQERLHSAPDAPGIYYFYDAHGNILYIGKAKSLKARISSYFLLSAHHTGKIKELVRQVRDVQWVVTGTELSALLLESKEIKRHAPQYNTLMKKYRRYPFLRLGAPMHSVESADMAFQRVDICYEIYDDGAEYFGPFSSRSSAEAILDIINRTFVLRKCADPFTPRADFSPCLYYQIRRCHAPCALLQSEEEYAQEVQAVRAFLSGERSGIVAVLKSAMQESSMRLDFEEAAILRNRMKELERIFFRQQQIASSINDNNVIIVIPTATPDKKLEVFFIRHGRLKFQRLVGKKLPIKELRQALHDVYGSTEHAPMYARKEEIDEMRIIASWIYQHRNDGLFLYMHNRTPDEGLEQLVDMLYKAFAVTHSYEPAEEYP
ncbi:MAG: DEDD exonuclease domain-containing protein [Bacteroidota bacterium]|nr:DEDD exonuclease domain-containing protein [Candidatus Kapabacteria bacterium]MDW8220651.1 DEDD exonuclease domain-containing protein [Bacteroidota bacterium]